MEVVVQGDDLQVALISSLAEARSGISTAAHVRLGLSIAAAGVKDLPTPLDQVTGTSQRVEQRARPVSDVLLVELKPPVPLDVVLQQP